MFFGDEMVKIRVNEQPTNKEVDSFLNQADKPYGADNRVERITISVTGDMYDKVEQIVRTRKRAKRPNRTMSALFVEALEFYLSQIKE